MSSSSERRPVRVETAQRPAAPPEATVLDPATAATVSVRVVPPRELRAGSWTRLGSPTVLGDAVTEHTLTGLAAQAQAAAHAQGYAAGWAEGRRAAEEQSAEMTRSLLAQNASAEERRDAEHQLGVAALRAAVARLDEAVAGVCARVEARTCEVAADLTEELLGRELRVAQSPGVDAVRRALALAPAAPVLRIRLSVEESADPGLAALAGGATVVPDPALRRGDALIETAEGVLDARVSSAMARVREVLLS